MPPDSDGGDRPPPFHRKSEFELAWDLLNWEMDVLADGISSPANAPCIGDETEPRMSDAEFVVGAAAGGLAGKLLGAIARAAGRRLGRAVTHSVLPEAKAISRGAGELADGLDPHSIARTLDPAGQLEREIAVPRAASKSAPPAQRWGKFKVGPAFATPEEAIAGSHPNAHLAHVTYKNADGKVVATWWEASEKETGLPAQVGHSEQKALTRVELKPRESLEIRGFHTPCQFKTGCHVIMEHTAATKRANITYTAVSPKGEIVEYAYDAEVGFIPKTTPEARFAGRPAAFTDALPATPTRMSDLTGVFAAFANHTDDTGDRHANEQVTKSATHIEAPYPVAGAQPLSDPTSPEAMCYPVAGIDLLLPAAGDAPHPAQVGSLHGAGGNGELAELGGATTRVEANREPLGSAGMPGQSPRSTPRANAAGSMTPDDPGTTTSRSPQNGLGDDAPPTPPPSVDAEGGEPDLPGDQGATELAGSDGVPTPGEEREETPGNAEGDATGQDDDAGAGDDVCYPVAGDQSEDSDSDDHYPVAGDDEDICPLAEVEPEPVEVEAPGPVETEAIQADAEPASE